MSGDGDGLTAREFFNQLLLPNFPGGFEDPKWRSLRTQRAAFNRLTADGIKRLKAGDWYGEGILLPRQSGSKPERIEARLWDALNIHLYDGTVFGHSIEYAGVRFYEAKPEPRTSMARREGARRDCFKWLRKEMMGERHQYKDDYLTEALDGRFPALTETAFRDIWKEAARLKKHSSWKPGPRKHAKQK